MKRTKIILSFLCLAFIVSSCSLQRAVMSAKVGHITPEIIQMPTVTELEVSESPVIADTVISRNIFNKDVGYMTKMQLQDALVASMLKKTGSDMLMEPTVDSDVTYDWFKSTLKLTVKGYPARYKGFRTITSEDVEMLNDLKATKQVGTISMSRFLRTDAGRAYARTEDVMNIADPIKPRKERWRRPTGYKGIYELSLGPAVGNELAYSNGDYEGLSASFKTSQGVQMKPCFYLGGGMGITYAEYEWNYALSNYVGVPLFAHMRAHFWNRKVAPFFDFKLGAMAMIANDDEVGGEKKYYWNGFFPNACVGLGFSFGKFSIGADYDIGFWPDDIDAAWQHVKVKLDLTF